MLFASTVLSFARRSVVLSALAGSLALLSLSCGGTSQQAEPRAALSGKVVERAEGYSSRPGWAEPDQAWSKAGETLIVVGYVSIAGDQRLEAGYRAADSYARAELLRFLTTRVVAVLTDEETSGGDRVLRESMETIASAVVDDWIIAGRYWEKRSAGSEERMHVFSRLEVDQAKVRELLELAMEGKDDLRVTSEEVFLRLEQRWQRIAEVTELSEVERDLPQGATVPEWARAGDGQDEEGFSFVCHASGPSEDEARALAQARCNEKLCRLFGVQITARSAVTEDLEGMTAESEVTEECQNVRLEGRQTRNKSSECTDGGCVFWLRQTFPKRAYEAEKQRLEQPNVIRQEVVISEGDRNYRDPAACESALRRYAEVTGLSAKAYRQRTEDLTSALKTCQGIDERDSGLFISLNLLLTENLWSFVFENGRGQTARGMYAAVGSAWKKQLETERFLTTRIQMVLVVVRQAVFPMQLFDATDVSTADDTSPSEFEALVKKAIEYPASEKPIASTHRRNIHRILLGAYWNRQRQSPTYRRFVLEQLGHADVTCDEPSDYDASLFSSYLAADGTLDETEYRAALAALERKPSRDMSRCLHRLVNEKKDSDTLRHDRVYEIAGLIAQGKLVEIEPKSQKNPPLPGANVRLFDSWLTLATAQEKLELYLRHRSDLRGTAAQKDHLIETVVRENFGGMSGPIGSYRAKRSAEEELSHCESLAGRLSSIRKKAAEFPLPQTDACDCLGLEKLGAGARSALVRLWLTGTDRKCKHFHVEEWPGGHQVWPYPKRRWGGDEATPFGRIPQVLRDEYKECRSASGIHGLDFTPMIHATLTGTRLSGVSIRTQIDGTLSRMTMREDRDAWVKVEDVMAAKKRFESCFVQAAEGYQVEPSQLKEKSGAPRRIWLEFGDQGVSHGYE